MQNVQNFRSEILLTATLRHPNIVNFVGSTWGRECFLILEWVSQGPLQGVLDNRGLTLRWEDPLLRLATDVARGMAYLHCREFYDEVTHRYRKCIMHRVILSLSCPNHFLLAFSV